MPHPVSSKGICPVLTIPRLTAMNGAAYRANDAIIALRRAAAQRVAILLCAVVVAVQNTVTRMAYRGSLLFTPYVVIRADTT